VDDVEVFEINKTYDSLILIFFRKSELSLLKKLELKSFKKKSNDYPTPISTNVRWLFVRKTNS